MCYLRYRYMYILGKKRLVEIAGPNLFQTKGGGGPTVLLCEVLVLYGGRYNTYCGYVL